MPKRVQSPSSINTYKQCPRRYFYQYILKYPTKENIYCVRGNIVHDTLEKFFEIDMSQINIRNFKQELSLNTKKIFDTCWKSAALRIQKTGISDENRSFFYTDSTQMLANWLNHFFSEVDSEMNKMGSSFKDAFNKLKPVETEGNYRDSDLMVRGYIDAVHKDGDSVLLIDYKTSKSSQLKKEYILQLGIYAVLYEKKHQKLPAKVGVWFLKDKPKILDVEPEMVKNALFEIEQIHFATESCKILDYPKKVTPLCKWSSGQCDFYDICKRHR